MRGYIGKAVKATNFNLMHNWSVMHYVNYAI